MILLAKLMIVAHMGLMHPYHVGITDLDWNQDEECFQAAMMLDDGDVEEALSLPLSSLLEGEPSGLWQEVETNFVLESDSVRASWELIGIEVEDDGRVMIYFQSQKMAQPAHISLRNTVLFKGLDHLEHKIHVTMGTEKVTLHTSIHERNVEHTF